MDVNTKVIYVQPKVTTDSSLLFLFPYIFVTGITQLYLHWFLLVMEWGLPLCRGQNKTAAQPERSGHAPGGIPCYAQSVLRPESNQSVTLKDTYLQNRWCL